jgi:hypothetical protein
MTLQRMRRIWNNASLSERRRWLRETGSWVTDAELGWDELMQRGGSQAEVIKDYIEGLEEEQ